MPMTRFFSTATLVTTLLVSSMIGCKAKQPVAEQSQLDAEVDVLLERGFGYLDQGLEDSAFAMFGQALLENPRIAVAHMGIGDIYKGRGDYDKASVRYELAAAIEPENYDAHYNLGVCKQVLGDLAFAIKSYKRAIDLKPGSAKANRDLASAYLQEGKPGLALVYIQRAAELDPESFEIQASRGFIHIAGEQFEQAVNAFRVASELAEEGDDLEPVLLGLGDAHVRMGNYVLALNTLEALVLKTPSALAYERMGVAMFKQRRYEGALENFKRALDLDGKDTAALNGLGVAYMTLYIEGGRSNIYQRDQALEAWAKSLELKPNQNQIKVLVSRYNNI